MPQPRRADIHDHDLHGFLLEMSPDIVALIDAFGAGANTADVLAKFRGTFGDADPAQFVDVLVAHFVLIEPDEDEIDGIWPMVPIKARWNTWRRRRSRAALPGSRGRPRRCWASS